MPWTFFAAWDNRIAVKILLVNSLYPPNVRGGAERAVQELAESLVAGGLEVTAASTAGAGAARTGSLNGVKTVYLPSANLHWPFDRVARSTARRKLWHLIDIYNPAMQARLARLIRRERPDIVHTSNLQGLSVAAWHAARAAQIPIVHTLQDYYLTCGRCSRYRNGDNCESTCWECAPFLLARRLASRCVAGVVGVSRFILEHHRNLGLFGGARFSGVIPHVTPPLPKRREAVSPGAALTFGYLGRLVPEKGIEWLLDTLAARRDRGWKLLIAGEGEPEYAQALRRRAEAQNPSAIRFLGWVEPAEFFPRIDVLVVPSRWHEPLARVVVEAHSYGIPVVGAARGGIPEQVENGVTGLLFDSEAPDSLAAAIDRLLADRSLARRLGQAAERCAEATAPRYIVEGYRKVYRAVLEAEAGVERKSI